MTKTLTRVYDDYAAAELAVRELKAAGMGDSHIGIVASNADGWHKPGGGDVDPKHDKDRDGKDDRAEGAATGGGMGAIAGGAAGVAAGLGMIAIPGIGPVVAAGWLAALASGAVAGGVTGGIIGALVESGTSKENAELYAEARAPWRHHRDGKGAGRRAVQICCHHGYVGIRHRGPRNRLSQFWLEGLRPDRAGL